MQESALERLVEALLEQQSAGVALEAAQQVHYRASMSMNAVVRHFLHWYDGPSQAIVLQSCFSDTRCPNPFLQFES